MKPCLLQFSLASFNILAGPAAQRQWYPYVQLKHLEWTRRRERLMNQMRNLHADIICCQEMNDFEAFFEPRMDALGYSGIYLQRPSLHVPPGGKRKTDGCAIFYNRDKFVELEDMRREVVFHDDHDRVGLGTVLRCPHGNDLLVGTTHIFWDSARVDDQLKEVDEFETTMKDLAESMLERQDHHTALGCVVAGDFNSLPGSQVYRRMSSSFLNALGANMTSAYQTCLGHEPLFTSVTHRRLSTIDYIWHSGNMRVDAIREMPAFTAVAAEPGPPEWEQASSHNECIISEHGIPNSQFGSDHLPIKAEFRIFEPCVCAKSQVKDEALEKSPAELETIMVEVLGETIAGVPEKTQEAGGHEGGGVSEPRASIE